MNRDSIFISLEYANLNPLKVFCSVFGLLFFCYFFDMAHFLIGNHDISQIMNGVSIVPRHIPVGAFGIHLFSLIFSYGETLPVLPNVFAYAAMTFVAIMFCNVFGCVKNNYVYFIVCALIVLSPMFISIFYYKFSLVSYMIAPLLVMYGFKCSFDREWTILGSCVVVLCFFLGLASYPAVLSMLLVLGCLWLFKENMLWNGSFKQAVPNIKRFLIFCGQLIIAICLYKLSTKLLVYFGLMSSTDYHINHFSLEEFVANAPATIIIAFKHLWVTQPFMPRELKLPLLAILLVGFVLGTAQAVRSAATWPQILLKIFLSCLFFSASIVFCKTAQLFNPVSSREPYELRFAVYCLLYIYAFFAIILLKQAKVVRTVSAALVIFCIMISVFNVLYAQRVWKSSYEKEISHYTRIVERIVTHENFDKNMQYTYIQMGEFNFRKQEYKKKYQYPARELVEYPLMAHWASEQLLREIDPSLKIAKSFDTQNWVGHGKDADAAKGIRIRYHDVLKAMDTWPSKKSIVIVDNVIFVALEQEMLEKYKSIE